MLVWSGWKLKSSLGIVNFIALSKLIAISIYSRDSGAVNLASPARRIKASTSPKSAMLEESGSDEGLLRLGVGMET